MQVVGGPKSQAVAILRQSGGRLVSHGLGHVWENGIRPNGAQMVEWRDVWKLAGHGEYIPDFIEEE
jgi:hypothetical protein